MTAQEITLEGSTPASNAAPIQASRSPKAQGRDWRGAGKAVRALIADPSRTELVFEIIDALNGPDDENGAEVFLETPEGAALLAAKPDLRATLRDRAALAAMPEASFGRAYLDFMNRAGIEADGLAEADELAATSAVDESEGKPCGEVPTRSSRVRSRSSTRTRTATGPSPGSRPPCRPRLPRSTA